MSQTPFTVCDRSLQAIRQIERRKNTKQDKNVRILRFSKNFEL